MARDEMKTRMKRPSTLCRPMVSRPPAAAPGFALVTTVSILVLLAVIAVGLLSLSSVTLRASGQGRAQAEARANARMALMLAIGDLQRELGPDRRINGPAGIDGEVPADRRNWLSVYESWPADDADRPEPRDQFRRFLVSSADPASLESVETARSGLTGELVALLGEGTLGAGTTEGRVQAGLVDVTAGGDGQLAWWVGDENSKVKINAGGTIPAELSDELLERHASQTAPGTGFRLVEELSGISGNGRGEWDLGEELRGKSVTRASVALLPGGAEDTGGLYHDVTTRSRGLLVDVRNGGLKRDLSLYLEQDLSPRLRQPLYTVDRGTEVNFSPDSVSSRDYDNLGETSGITMEELWLYYNLYKEVSHDRAASSDAKVGIIPGNYPTLVAGGTRDEVLTDPFYIYKRRVYSQVKYILSLAAVPSTQRGRYDLKLSVDPVVVLWNPNNVALEYQPGGFTTVGYSSLPYDCRFEVTGSNGTTTTTVPFSSFFAGVNGIQAQVGRTHKIVLQPGESRVFSPAADRSGGNRVTADLESGWSFTTGAVFSNGSFPSGLAGADRVRVTLKPRIQNASDDYITYWFGARSDSPTLQEGTVSMRNDMAIGEELPEITTPQAYRVSNVVAEEKVPLMLFSYYLRPENDTATPSRSWIWNNPAIVYRWPANDSLSSRLHSQFEMKVVGVDNWENPYVQVTPANQGYWGGGVRADFGVPFFTFRSVPLTPPQSLAALQHACANGFRRYWKDSPISIPAKSFPAGAETLDGYQYLGPKASRIIGNSFGHPLIPADATTGNLYAHLGVSNGTPPKDYTIADHSYLANAALWDTWFFSSLAPQTVAPYGADRRDLQEVLEDFFPDSPAEASVPLPSSRLEPYRYGEDDGARRLIRSGRPARDAYRKLAAYLTVDGAFNVNSTSVTAWKAILGSLRDHATLRQAPEDRRPELEGVAGETPVNGFTIANGPLAEPSGDPQEPDQWTGFRSLSDEQIEALATALVEEIRLRGPFLCLSDFVNRRPGSDDDLARQGALQAAIERAGINGDLESGFRGLRGVGSAPFPEAGEGSKAAGIPGYVCQADLLTPLGPILQARSDTFVIRSYGAATNEAGEVIARAWCEATLQRVPDYLDPADAPETREEDLTAEINRRFGRRFELVDFRWLRSAEI